MGSFKICAQPKENYETTGLLERQHQTLNASFIFGSKELGIEWSFLIDQDFRAIKTSDYRNTNTSTVFALYDRHFSLDIPLAESIDHAIKI